MIEQQYAMTGLLIMTTVNVFLGIVMIADIIPVEYGMTLAGFSMACIVWIVKKQLMGDQRLWESPKQYKERIERKKDHRILLGRSDNEGI
jgi:hypothetical protein